jgi:hypothetical protein
MASSVVYLPDGTTITSGLLEGSSQHAEVMSHINAVIANQAALQKLDQQITSIQIKQAAGTATQAEIKELAILQANHTDTIAQTPDPTQTSLTSPTGNDIALSILQAQDIASYAKPVVTSTTSSTTTTTTTTNISAKLKVKGSSSASSTTTLASMSQPQVNGNNTSVQYGTPNYNDLSSYITKTTFLNPWGRNRQCDDDLKNLMAYINADMMSELGAWINTGVAVAASATD